MNNKIDSTYLRRLRILGFIEGLSTLILFFVAMPLKYIGGMPLAVSISGSIHGILFILLVFMFYQAVSRIPISPRLAMAGVFGAVIPFGPFIVDRWLLTVSGAEELNN